MCLINQLKSVFNNEDSSLIFKSMKEKYELSNLEYLNLIAIFMTYVIISKNPEIPSTCVTICNTILKYRHRSNENINSQIFYECINTFVINELSIDSKNEERILKNLESGLLFHSFNSSFLPKIQEQGLVLHDKPWNLNEVEKIRMIFKKYGIQNIFGMYQGKIETPIFFSNQLCSSPYYGLSSPTFFRKFIENDKSYFNVFLNRDREMAIDSIKKLCFPLTEEEKKYVYNFFSKYWTYFASDDLPCIAIANKKDMGIQQPLPIRHFGESTDSYITRCFMQQSNVMIKNDIPRDRIEIFSYENLAFVDYEKNKNI